MKVVTLAGHSYRLHNGVGEQALRDAAAELAVAGRALSWLERARLSVMAGAADYERGYANVRALVDACAEARAAYDGALAAAAGLVDGDPAAGMSREAAAVFLPELLGLFLAAPDAPPAPPVPTNREG